MADSQNNPPSIHTFDLRLVHIEDGFKELKELTKSTNERVDQIYAHLIGNKTNSSNQKTSWRQWAGATVLSILALVVALWDRVGSTPS